MKKTTILSAFCLLPWAFASCDRHSWQETKQLHEHHGNTAAHNDEHAAQSEHAPNAEGKEGGQKKTTH